MKNKYKKTISFLSRSYLVFIFLTTGQVSKAQEKPSVKFGNVTARDFQTTTYSAIPDSSANAIILSDVGSTNFVGNKAQWFSYQYKRHTRIRILNKKAFDDFLQIRIRLYGRGSDFEKVDNITASTYNLDNGRLIETKLDPKDVFEDRLDSRHKEEKFTMPAVKEGSIIEYSYTITSSWLFNMPEWTFQHVGYPCLWSDYQVEIPEVLYYVLVRQGVHSFYIDKAGQGREFYTVKMKEDDPQTHDHTSTERALMVGANTVKHEWAMKNVPAFSVESYITTPNNYVDKIGFQLFKVYNGEEHEDIANSWRKFCNEQLDREDFGRILQDNENVVIALTDKVVANVSGKLEQAETIYRYVKDHFTCTNYSNPWIVSTIPTFVKNQNGTVGEINLLMAAMLRHAHIQADPVLLSTRWYGFNVPNYPIEDRLNYVIVKTKIDDKIYYLDAAHPLLGFGQLDASCYNGHARIISETDSGSVYFYPDSLKERKTTMVLLTSGEKAGLEGTYQSTPGNMESYRIRQAVGKTGLSEYFKSVQTSHADDLSIGESGIDSLGTPGLPVTIHYNFKLNIQPGVPVIYINPYLDKWVGGNPFKDSKREYPVEMENIVDDYYIFNLDIPDGYQVDELPKSARVALNESEGLFEYIIGASDSQVQLKVHFKLNKAFYPPEAYANLRDFYAYVIKKESEQIVLKKKG